MTCCCLEEGNISYSQSQGRVQRILEVGLEHGYMESEGGQVGSRGGSAVQ